MKKKIILVVGAGQYQICGITRLQEKGYYVIAIDGDEHAIGKKYADNFYCIDITAPEEILKIITLNRLKITSAMCFSTEIALRTVAYINDKLNLPGISIQEAAISTDKFKQRSIMNQIGIPCPYYHKISRNDYKDIETLKLDYPVIIKPTDSAGSRGVSIIKNKKDLLRSIHEAVRHSQFDSQVIIEEFIPGIEFTVEAIIIDSKITILGISEKKKPVNNFTVSVELFYNSPLSLILKNEIELIVKSFLAAVKFNNTITHTEVIYSYKDNQIYLIESTVRSGGFKIFEGILPQITGIDIVGITIDTLLNKKPKIQQILHKPAILSFFYNNKGKINKITILDEALPSLDLIEYDFFLKEGSIVGELDSDGARLGYYIVHGDSWQAVYNNARQLEYAIRFEII